MTILPNPWAFECRHKILGLWVEPLDCQAQHFFDGVRRVHLGHNPQPRLRLPDVVWGHVLLAVAVVRLELFCPRSNVDLDSEDLPGPDQALFPPRRLRQVPRHAFLVPCLLAHVVWDQ